MMPRPERKADADKTASFMLERHEREQFFWDDATVQAVADIAARFELPCALCAPLLGAELEKRAVPTRILDIDARFSHLDGFSKFDIYRPVYRAESVGVIVCDPPFWIVSLSQLFSAIRLLSHHNLNRKLAICYPTRRGDNLCATFARFGLQPTGFSPRYLTVQATERNKIEFFANFEWFAR